MRIAVVCSDLGIRIPGDKGASVHLTAIATALSRLGNEVALVGVAGRGAPPAEVEPLLFSDPEPDDGHPQGLRRELQRVRFVERVAREAREPLLEFAPDAVYERLSLFGTAGMRLASATGATHALEVNALLAEEQARWRGLRLARRARRRERRVVRAAALRVAVSEELAARVRQIASSGDTVVVPNAVDATAYAHLPERRDARQRMGLPPDAITLGFLGALRPWHGLEYAIDALPRLPNVLLAIAGDGELRSTLESRARERAVAERVRWLGQLPPAEVPPFLAALDIGLIPYPELRDFAFSPLKLYEYLAAGVPVVASDIGQVGAVLRAMGCGRLVRPGDPAALAEGVMAVLRDPEPSRARAMEARGRALTEHSWEERARRISGFLSSRLGNAMAA
jgi:glycosyltransferase involved in cell wall biosynthesis